MWCFIPSPSTWLSIAPHLSYITDFITFKTGNWLPDFHRVLLGKYPFHLAGNKIHSWRIVASWDRRLGSALPVSADQIPLDRLLTAPYCQVKGILEKQKALAGSVLV